MKKIVTTAFMLFLIICLSSPSKSFANTLDDDWWNQDWEYRKKITIDHNMIAADFENFPILFHNISFNFSDHPQSEGYDFVFISIDGTMQYNHEIEYYNKAIGELIAWVNITSLSSTENTSLYIYYGNQNCSNQENKVGTWDNNYVGVWHCNNKIKYDEGDIKDSTIYCNNGTSQNMEAQDLVDGKISKAFNFDGNNEKVLVYDSQHGSLDLTDSITLECWWNADDLSNSYNTLMGKSSEMGAYQYEYRIRDTILTDNVYSLLTYGGLREDNKTHSTNTWYHGVVTLDSSNVIFYNEGTISTIHDTPDLLSVYGQFGFGAAGDYGNYFTGIIDEVRVSNIARSASWIETNYNTMNNPDSFLILDDEEYNQVENTPPNAPEINGPKHGKVGTRYNYTFNSSDPEDDDVFYYIIWGDGYIEVWNGPHHSGHDFEISHTYLRQGNYTIEVKAKDTYGAKSNWSYFEIEIPRTRTTPYQWYHTFLESFPILERLLNLLR